MLVKNPGGRIVEIPDDHWPKLQAQGFERIASLALPRGGDPSITLSVIVLAWNRLELTKACLASIMAHTRTDYEIVVVNQASNDGTADFLAELAAQDARVVIVSNKTNRGVAGGRNDGIQAAHGRFLAFFDNDSTVGPKWWETCRQVFEANPRAGFVGRLGTMFHAFNQAGMRLAQLPSNTPVQCDVVSGGATVIRREVFAEIGLLDERMGEFWHEDSELCLRAKIAGWYSYAIDFAWEHKSHASYKAEKGEAWMEKFQANLDYIVRQHRRENIIFIHRDYHGEACMDSLCIVATNLANELRKIGWVVIRKPTKDIVPIALRVCTGFVLEHLGTAYWWTHAENDVAPRSWLEPLKEADFILAPSEFCGENLVRTGLDTDKIVYRHSPDGFDPAIFNPEVKPALGLESIFVFFANGATQPRKGTDVLLRAYFAEFNGDDQTVLYLKDGNYGHKAKTAALIRELQGKHANAPKIVHVFERWTPQKLAAYYAMAAVSGAFVNPHRSEGFGLCAIEAMACGATVILTDYGGVREFAYSRFGELRPGVEWVKCDVIPSTFHNNAEERYYEKDETPCWAEPRQDDLQRVMRRATESQAPLSQRIESARLLAKEWSFENRARLISEYLSPKP